MLVKRLREVLGSGGDSLERVADAIKDAILDWELPETDDSDVSPLDALQPMAPADFIEAMRPRIEETLLKVADAINEAPTGQLLAASEARVTDLILEMALESLQVGLRLRLEATQAGSPTTEMPQGAWARKYRKMRTARDTMPADADSSLE
ncbi:MAG: hypothetical protein K2R98_09895 [Gemmataceae bacterium]|nr:hypothetical protein [Gemmataceae bacterium]